MLCLKIAGSETNKIDPDETFAPARLSKYIW